MTTAPNHHAGQDHFSGVGGLLHGLTMTVGRGSSSRRAEALPLADGTATVLWSIASVHHWIDVAVGLREARRVLGPGGRFVAMERRVRPGATGLASHGWTDDQVATFASACGAEGFTGVRTEHAGGGRRGVVAVVAAVPAGGV